MLRRKLGLRFSERLVAIGLAAVFAAAAIAKVVNFTDFLRVLRGYEAFSPLALAPLAITLISLELVIAAALVSPRLRRSGAVIAALTLLFFIAFVAHALHRGLVVDCGCFTFLQNRKIGVGLLVQDSILLVLAVLLAAKSRGRVDVTVPARQSL